MLAGPIPITSLNPGYVTGPRTNTNTHDPRLQDTGAISPRREKTLWLGLSRTTSPNTYDRFPLDRN